MVIDWASFGVFITVCGASISGILHTIQQSRCRKIILCCGGFQCDREPPDVEESTPSTPSTEATI